MNGKMLDFGCESKPYKDLFYVDEYIDLYYDEKHIHLDNGSIDCIFTSEVFEHIFNIDEIIKELNRVLKKEGKILITTPFVWDEHEKPYDFARYTSFRIRYLLEQNGFKVISMKKTNNYVETIFQMWNAYLIELFPQNKILTLFLHYC